MGSQRLSRVSISRNTTSWSWISFSRVSTSLATLSIAFSVRACVGGCVRACVCVCTRTCEEFVDPISPYTLYSCGVSGHWDAKLHPLNIHSREFDQQLPICLLTTTNTVLKDKSRSISHSNSYNTVLYT